MEETDKLAWRKSTFSGNGGCVEVGTTPAGIVAGIRDSKSPEHGHLALAPEVFAAFLASVKNGQYDLA